MKSYLVSLILSLLTTWCDPILAAESKNHEDVLPSDLTAEERALVNDVREMFKQRNIKPVMARVEMERLQDWMVDLEGQILEGILNEGLEWIELTRVDPPEIEKKERDGSVLVWSRPLKWKLKIYQPSDDITSKTSYTLSFAEHEGRIVMVTVASRSKTRHDKPYQPLCFDDSP